MSGKPRPWEGVIPERDVAAFARGFDPAERPLRAGTRPAVIVVDMTREFVDSAYPTGCSETGYPATEANAVLLDAARAAGTPVFYTKMAPPGATAIDFPRHLQRWNMPPPPPPDPSLPPGDEVMPQIAPREGDVVIYKGLKPSGFFGTPLASYLIYHGVDTCIVTGMTTSGCVRATVVDAFEHNFHVVLPFECCADRSQISHAVNLFDMHMKYADVVALEEVLEYLAALGGGRRPAARSA